jgi:hypothetical protein
MATNALNAVYISVRAPLGLMAWGMLISVILRITFINHPPDSIHVWRQCNTMAVARNLYEESMNPLHLRVDNRFDTDGITGGNFPAYEFLTASIYHLTGEKYWVSRSISLLLHLLGAWGIFRLTAFFFQHLKDPDTRDYASVASSWAYLFSPSLFYFGICALPDNLALTASLWGAYFLLRFCDSYLTNEADAETELFSGLLGTILLALSGLTKIYFLAIGLPIVVWVLFRFFSNGKPIQKLLVLSFLGLIITGIPVWWYLHAADLIKMSGLTDFGIEFRPAESWKKGLDILAKNLTSDLPELLLNYAGTVMLLIGLFRFKLLPKNLRFLMTIWAIGLSCYHVIELRQMEVHDYYMWTHLPLLFLLASFGWAQLRTWNEKMALGLLILLPVFASIRILPARFLTEDRGIPIEFTSENTLRKLQEAVPDDALCIVGKDDSRCIYFYFLQKKGWAIAETAELTQKNANQLPAIRTMIVKGARYLYLRSAAVPAEVQPFIRSKKAQIGDWNVYELLSVQ